MRMNQAEIRLADLGDAEQISAVCGEDLGYPCEAALVQDKIERLDPIREAVFVAVIDTHIVGFVHVERYDLLYCETMANILGLAVRAAYRHRGIGAMLMRAAEEWASANHIQAMRLNSGMSRTEAHGFYRHLGYDTEKEQIRFEKHLSSIERRKYE